MPDPLYPGFTRGTHRLVSPERTMERIAPVLPRCGITRIAEITGLDEDLGVPTYSAIRPAGLVLQTGNGKGLTRAAARVSAAMEAIELHHAENPDPDRFVRASQNEMERRGRPTRVPGRDEDDRRFHHSPDYIIDWVRSRDLVTDTDPWIPASAACFIEPTIYRTNTNGLASGNHAVEATLHALYELLERDAISRVVVGDMLRVQHACSAVDTATIDDPVLRRILDKIHAARSQLVLLWVPTEAPVHVFWAVLLDHQPHRAATALVTGAGAHPNIEVAASRAITEAVQSRLTIVQAARDDIIVRPSFTEDDPRPGAAFRFFAELPAAARWSDLRSAPGDAATTLMDLRERLDSLLTALAALGHDTVLRVDLGQAPLGIPVVKIIVPSLRFHRSLF